MKLFGDYLIDKKLINEESLVDALLEQSRSLPSTAELARASGQLSPTEILRVFRRESADGVGFIAAAKALGLWNDALQKYVFEQMRSARQPLVEILVRKGHFTADKMNAIFDEFAGSLQETGAATASPAASDVPVGASTARNEAMQDLVAPHLKALAQIFDGAVMTEPSAEELETATSALRVVRGVCRLHGAARIESLASKLEMLVSVFRASSEKSDESRAGFAIIGTDAVQFLRTVTARVTSASASDEDKVFGAEANDSEARRLEALIREFEIQTRKETP